MRIGIDLDNTLVDYREPLLKAAREIGIDLSGATSPKRDLRDFLRRGDGGDAAWQSVQAKIYGPLMVYARLAEGAKAFLDACLAHKVDFVIVSHKTVHNDYDPQRTDLRSAALDWLAACGFFSKDGFGISREAVFFESDRALKIERIAKIGVTDFIDDLEEVLSDPFFPLDVRRHLYAPGVSLPSLPFSVYGSWREIENVFFPESR